MDIKDAKLEELLLILEIKKMGLQLKDSFQNIWTEEEIYRTILHHYSKENHKDASRDELYTWLKNQARFPLLNELLKILVHNLIYDGNLIDHFIVNNFGPLLEIMMALITTWSEEEKEIYTTLPNMDIFEVHSLVREFLKEVDPTLQWLSIYDEMLETKKIKILNVNENLAAIIGKENACFHHKREPFIVIYPKGNIEDVIAIIHEFAHYINFYHHPNAQISRTLLESSSIFYEYYCLLFLEKKGYSKEIIETMKKDRLSYTYSLSIHIFDICNYLKEFIENHKIAEGKDKIFHLTCDNCIQQLVAHPQDFYTCYPYIIGNYLALKGMEQIISENNILPKIKELTENLYHTDPTTFFQIVGCEIEGTKQKKKSFLS